MNENESAPVPAPRIHVRPLANPLPLGLYSFGIGMMLLAAHSSGWVPLTEAKQVGLVLTAFVVPLEGLAAIFAFLARDTVAGTVLGLFTTSWLTLGVSLLTGTPGVTVMTLGVYELAFAAPVLVLAAVAATGKPLIAPILTLSATRAILDGLYQLTGTKSLEQAGGYVAAVIAGLAWYAGSALLVEEVRGRPLLPVFRRGAGAQAMSGPVEQQVGHALGEPGVRQQL